MAETSGNVLVSAWMPSNYQTRRCIYLSVWIGIIHYYSKIGRVLLAFDQLLHNICCYCTHSTKKGCIHKSVTKWYLSEAMPSIFDNSRPSIVIKNTIEKWGDNYFCRLTDYLMEYAMLPFEIPDDCLKETFSTGIVLSPTENVCDFCHSQLVDVESNDKAMLFTQFGVVRNVKIWNKHCHSCKFDYWHSNMGSGLFNFDNRVFVSLDWLVWLRSAIEEHIAISREVSMVAKRYRVNIDADKIRKAYFKFESLVDLDDQFKCCLCGYHPVILIFDVISKCAFKMPYIFIFFNFMQITPYKASEATVV